jgi:hypothetical protein
MTIPNNREIPKSTSIYYHQISITFIMEAITTKHVTRNAINKVERT